MTHSDWDGKLTRDRIQALLLNGAQGPTAATYGRLMEIYCVIKAGGVAMQIAAAQHLEATEKAMLQAEIEALRRQGATTNRLAALEQEIKEVELYVRDRIQYLNAIDPQAAAVVASCLPEMDAYFAAQRSSSDVQS